MAEYKDITSIKEHIAHVKRNARSENSAYLIGYISALSTVEGMIESLPAADVEPVKYGHWIFKKRIKLVPTGQTVVAEDRTALALKKYIMVKVPYCSICGEHGDCEEDATPYCPNCGAKMDGKEVQE